MHQQNKTLYDPSFEHENCGIGAVVNIDGIQSNQVVDDALLIVEKLEHRAGQDATGKVGDGVGILLQICHEFFLKETKKLNVDLGEERNYGVGLFFFPQDETKRKQAKELFEQLLIQSNLEKITWREVPSNPQTLGKKAVDCMPVIEQCFIKKPENCAQGLAFDRLLYILRRTYENSVNEDTYVVSLSSRTIVYKGMFLVGQLREFYTDLQDQEYKSAIAIVHSRFSTNTNASWKRAHPNRIIAHNGEINTIRGNVGRMGAREEIMFSTVLKEHRKDIIPVVNPDGSDSARLDNTLEFLYMSGMELPLAMMIAVPEPWAKDKLMSQEKREFYHYYATMMEPWDGPAAILFSDGDQMGAVLDRNGLRPSRYYITDNNTLILSSEIGVLDIEPSKVVKKARLQPGKILLVDTKKGTIITDEECKEDYASRQPYGAWLEEHLLTLDKLPAPSINEETHTEEERSRLYKVFGYTYDDVKNTIMQMANVGGEPTVAMGADIPLAMLSQKHQPLFYYFKQLFAQVTNPPIDSLREEIVTDSRVYIGSEGNILAQVAKNCQVLELESPIITQEELNKIKELKTAGFQTITISLLYHKDASLESAMDQLFDKAQEEINQGANVLILSDRGVDKNSLPIPSLLAVSAMEQYLLRTKQRTKISIIIESAEPKDVHQCAALLGYGARAIQPYLAHECIKELISRGILEKEEEKAIAHYNGALEHGMVKVAAKMGISCLQSYQSAQIFEAIGIKQEVIDKYFTNTVSRVGGIGLEELKEGALHRHSLAFDGEGLCVDQSLDSIGFHKLRQGEDKEEHLYNPATIIALQEATRNGDYNRFKEYSHMVNEEHNPYTLRGLLDFATQNTTAISIDEVEPVSEIVKRFKTGAMSYGSISIESHQCMAVAMNRLGGKSNSGEGGENQDRLGTERNSAIKQVASGRFGVTSEYLLSAREIQIKMAQGAKPGEGGHLPGTKVYPWVAKTRHSTPGVSLISPPPHHDIYSIEDLAQLIYDLKNANRQAQISVKLVSEAGVGTIAAGVAKAGARVVLISGYDGGTGAAPQTSVYHAGLPWELGVAEAHQTLIQNGLRGRVSLETDGKLMTGRDVAVATLLGAEEFGFATAPLVAMGCMMMRVCNLDTCPVGIATQNEELRKCFTGKVEAVMNFMTYVAQELREIMALLGFKTLDEMIGRTDLLKEKEGVKSSQIDMSRIINSQYAHNQVRHFTGENMYDFKLENTLDEKVLLPKFEKAICAEKAHIEKIDVYSMDRTLGTILGSEITKALGTNLEDDTYVVHCTGGAGQSFGAFIPKGMTMTLEGDANDYIGKGLSGGKIMVYPSKESTFVAEENIIIGNVALYGATSGEAYFNGIAGERFSVRNSGAITVVEGCGDHGLEYMTGGRAVILGETGKNLAAGMSGGIAYVLDESNHVRERLNKELVSMMEVTNPLDIEELKTLITKHEEATGSKKAHRILKDFDNYIGKFKKIVPNHYQQMMDKIANYQAQGFTLEEAKLKAFMDSKKAGGSK